MKRVSCLAKKIVFTIILSVLFNCTADAVEKPEIFVQVGHLHAISSLVFSPRGDLLLSTSTGRVERELIIGTIAKIWDAKTGRELKSFVPDTKNVTNEAFADFSPDGSQILIVHLNDLAVIDIATGNHRIIKDLQAKGIRRFNAAAISPDNKTITILCDEDTMHVLDIASGSTLRTVKSKQDNALLRLSPASRYYMGFDLEDRYQVGWVTELLSGKRITRVNIGKEPVPRGSYASFSRDGRKAVFGMYSLGDTSNIILWDFIRGHGRELKVNGEFVYPYPVSISQDGRYFFFMTEDRGEEKTLTICDASTGAIVRTMKGHNLTTAAFHPSGQQIIIGDKKGNITLHNILTGKEIMSFGSKQDYQSLVVKYFDRYLLTSTGNETVIWDIYTGTLVKGSNKEMSIKEILSYADKKAITIKDGKETYTASFTTGESTDGKFRAQLFNGMVKLYDKRTNKEVAQFVSFKDGEWVVITPEGYFNASANGARYLNVRIGNSVYSIDNFFERFFNPVYVASVLQSRKVEAVADIRKGILTPPEVRIISPEPNAAFSSDVITITVSARDTGGGIDEIILYQNEKAIGEDQRAIKVVPKGAEVIKTYTVTLVDGLNRFKAVGFSKDRTASNPYELTVRLTAPQKDISMYIFALGINRYKNPALNLNYAEPDAKGIVDFFRQKGQGLFKKVDFIEVYNEQGTKEIILSKLRQLQKAQPQDAVLIYIAGHGENIDDKWYFIPHELTYPEREEEVKSKGISSDEISRYIKDIKAQKVLVLIDACKSGAALIAFRGFEDRKALSQLSRSTGVHIIAASTKDQFASEVKELGHGVFTYTLLEGLKGKASGGDKTVTVLKLKAYVDENLPEITKRYKQEAQYPVGDARGMDFPLVVLR